MQSLADALREFSADELTRLLADRPDLATPPPTDLTDLAERAAAAPSVRRALDTLDRPQLAVAEALAALPTADGLERLLGFDPEPGLVRLRSLALVWGDEPVRGLRQAFEPYAAGLAAPSPTPLSPTEIDQALAGLPAAAREVLEKLMWGPPTGAVRHADRIVAEPVTPIDHLLLRGLLRPAGPHTVVLPREVALHARGGFLREPVDEPPVPSPGRRAARIIDSAAVGGAFEFVHGLEGLLDELTRRAPAPLRTGGVASRDLTVIARAVGAPEERAGFLLEVARAAGLVTATGPAIVPTEAFDRWLTLAPADRWAQLLRHWFRSPRWAASARAEGGRPLGPGQDTPWAVEARRAVLIRLAPGDAVDPQQLGVWAAWHRPALTRFGDPHDFAAAVLTEAEWLGLIALGQASALVTALTGTLPPTAAELFPAFVDHVVLQGDLTAVATGPLDRRVAAALALLADIESRGGGGVFRFTAASVRRAFDAGWDETAIEEWLRIHSRTGVPQPLRYLIADVARLHGTVRVGAARAYVRIDDPARLSTVLAHPEAAALGLRQVGPEALVADADPDEVVALLRAVGLAPAAENAAGEMVASPPPRRPPAPARTRRTSPDPADIVAALVTRRDQQRTAARTDEALEVLHRAAQEARAVEVEYVGLDGTRAHEVMVPATVGAGMVRLAGADTTMSLPLARVITAQFPEDHPEESP